MITNNEKRWVIAQEYELEWWSKYSDNIDWYKKISRTIINKVSPFIDITHDTNIIEIGSGASGGITYLNSNNKHAIDPLENYFSTRKRWISQRDKRVKYY